ncbi:MerR family DNA-binding transcriptional regulator [Salinispira pacifica]
MKTDQFLGVSRLARLSGVSVRTLRYYDQIGLLTPRHRDANGFGFCTTQ